MSSLKLSDIIHKLNEIIKIHGDLSVVYGYNEPGEIVSSIEIHTLSEKEWLELLTIDPSASRYYVQMD